MGAGSAIAGRRLPPVPRSAARGSQRLGSSQPLNPEFYARPVLEVARDLIGCVVEHAGLSGVIVETEAYHESEPACHAFVGVTARTRTLFEEPGVAYVYRSYGIHALLNAVCEPAGVGAAVLIRALEPLSGIEEMRARRGRTRLEDLCSGPGKLTQALGVELSHNGGSLIDGPVVIRAGELGDGELPGAVEVGAAGGAPASVGAALAPPGVPAGGGDPFETPAVVVGTRIGITKAVELRWRFCAVGNPHVSRPRL
jgi:DNA-3-methyladenine glycosylase